MTRIESAPLEHTYAPRAGLREAHAALAIAHPAPFELVLTPGTHGVSRSVPHISNVEYVRWLDRAAELHADSLGMTRQSMVAQGHMWFVARHEIDYRGEAFPGEALHLFTWVRTMGRSTSWRDTLVVRAADSAPVCIATTCWAFVDLATRRPARIPPHIAQAFQPLEPPRCTLRSS